MPDEWFRTPCWDEAAREDFEKRLGRARSHNRAQYLRIKAIALRDAGLIEPAQELLMRVAEQPDVNDSEAAFAQELLGDIAAASSRPKEAERYYRWVLDEHPSLNGTTGNIELSFAELLLGRNAESARTEAQRLLDSWLARPVMKLDSDLFRWHLALITLAGQLGDEDTIQRAAKTALALTVRGPQLPRHKDVGLADADASTLARLHRLASDKAAQRPNRRIRSFLRR